MSGENFVDYLVVAVIVAGCGFLLARFVKQAFTGGGSSTGCSCGLEEKNCAKLEATRSTTK